MLEIQHLLTKLIDIPSITGNEKDITFLLRDILEGEGMKVSLFKIEKDRCNLFAYFSENPEIILTTHMDTVAPFIKAEVTGDTIYGRGACDAKGQISAMIIAALALPKLVKEKVGLLFVIGEETNSLGAKSVEKMKIKPKYFINGEPTENKLVHAQKGVYFFEAIAYGKSSHSGYPDNGTSAIHILLDFFVKIKQHSWPKNKTFGETFFNVGKIEGGEAINTLASTAKAECGFRIVSPIDEIIAEVEKLKPAEIKINTISKTPAIKLYCPESIKNTVHVNYGSDVFFLQKTAPTLMIGPGTILDAHTKDEKIKISELKEAVGLYTDLIKILISK